MGDAPVYLDNNATTRPTPGVAAAVHDALTRWWHNPSSVHRPGQDARAQLELARQAVADLLHAAPREVTFTSGGTESINLALRGVLGATHPRGGSPPVLVTTKVEHAAVRDLAADLESSRGAAVRWAPITREGLIDPGALAALLTPDVALVSIQWANNETGVIQDVAAIGRLCRERRILFHCDATQWVGKEPMPGAPGDVCDLLTCSAHKFHGPKGVGVLWAAPAVRLRPQLRGTQELGRRGGTENVPGIVGAGQAAREAAAWLADEGERRRLASLRDGFESRVLAACPGAQVNGSRDRRLWNTTNIAFPRLEAEAILLMLSERGVCASAGAACSSGSLDPSPVLLAMGVPEHLAHGSLRFSLSRDTTRAEAERGASIVVECVSRLARSLPGK